MNAIDHEELLHLETRVWQALVDGDAAADAALLADDFLGVYPSGFARRDDHLAQLADGPTVSTFELSDATSFAVADDAVMLSYRASYRRPASGDAAPRSAPESASMYVSSLWVRRDGDWVNVFSQDTPAG